MEYDINDLTSIGSVRDTPAYMLPPEAFTLALNMRCVDGGVARLLGWQRTFDPPATVPHFVLPVVTPAALLWVYCSLTHAIAYDGSAHSNITRTAANYTAANSQDWNGTFLGNIPILNNGADVPQSWSPTTPATRLVDLPNWPTDHRAKVIRAFGPFLVAIHITKAGVTHPHMVKWSHPADPGTVPPSWDVADPSRDAGEQDLPDVQSGLLRDALPLGDTMFLYKDNSTWKMRFIGGRQIFSFGESAWLTNVGILAPRCVCVTGDGLRQVVVTQDDIIWHNGNTVRSILDKRQKRRLFNEMDVSSFATSFLFANPAYNEVWFCYPSAGMTHPDKALILNYGEGGSERWAVTEADGISFRHAAVGGVENPSEDTWEANENEWEVDDGSWSELLRRRVILAGTEFGRLYLLDQGTSRDGLQFDATLQRVGISLAGKKRDGSLIVDHQIMKMLTRLWPKIKGGPVRMRFGAQQTVDGPIQWGAPVVFDSVTQTFTDPGPVTGRAVGWEMATLQNTDWKLDGYKIDMHNVGNY